VGLRAAQEAGHFWKSCGLLNGGLDDLAEVMVDGHASSDRLGQQALIVAERLVAKDPGIPQLDQDRADILMLPLDRAIGTVLQE
jgi:hypothetical protein